VCDVVAISGIAFRRSHDREQGLGPLTSTKCNRATLAVDVDLFDLERLAEQDDVGSLALGEASDFVVGSRSLGGRQSCHAYGFVEWHVPKLMHRSDHVVHPGYGARERA